MELVNGVETVSGASILGITIDNIVIGGTTAAAGTFTTLSADSIADLDSIALFDSNDSHQLTLTWDENDTSNRTLKLKVSTGSRTLTITGDPTIADWFDQSTKQAASPTFAALTLTAALTVANGGTGAGTHTNHGVLLGQAAATFVATTAGTDGQILKSSGASADPSFENMFTISTHTEDYTVLLSDVNGSLRMNSAADKILSLPSVGASEDGYRFTFVKQGAGKVTLQAADTDIIDSGSAAGTLFNSQAGETYANVTLEYLHATVTWLIVAARGTWSTT